MYLNKLLSKLTKYKYRKTFFTKKMAIFWQWCCCGMMLFSPMPVNEVFMSSITFDTFEFNKTLRDGALMKGKPKP
jgi:hypothetical protein